MHLFVVSIAFAFSELFQCSPSQSVGKKMVAAPGQSRAAAGPIFTRSVTRSQVN
jgi:hypothetical protein